MPHHSTPSFPGTTAPHVAVTTTVGPCDTRLQSSRAPQDCCDKGTDVRPSGVIPASITADPSVPARGAPAGDPPFVVPDTNMSRQYIFLTGGTNDAPAPASVDNRPGGGRPGSDGHGDPRPTGAEPAVEAGPHGIGADHPGSLGSGADPSRSAVERTLRYIAGQPLIAEMTPETLAWADFEFAYEAMIEQARAALARATAR